MQRVGQLAKEGVIHKTIDGRYDPAMVAAYYQWKAAKSETSDQDWSELLEMEKYREKKRQNDLEEQLVAPVSVLEDVLERCVAAMVPTLESLPLLVKRHWPEVTGDQIMMVKKAVAECRNALADTEIEFNE